MNCPRCGTPMELFETPVADEASGRSYRCVAPGGECGVWFDGSEFAALHERLAEPGVRDALINAERVGREQGRSDPHCPRCANGGEGPVLDQVTFVGLTLDLCSTCLGLWIDREEIPTLLNALPLYEAGEGGEVRITHYRQPVIASEMQPNRIARTRCASCKQLVALDQTLATEHGWMCVLCADAHERNEIAPALRRADPVQSGRNALWEHVRSALGHLFG